MNILYGVQQRIVFFLKDASGDPVSAAPTVWISKDGGTFNAAANGAAESAAGDISPAPGCYNVILTAAETTATVIAVYITASGALPICIAFYTTGGTPPAIDTLNITLTLVDETEAVVVGASVTLRNSAGTTLLDGPRVSNGSGQVVIHPEAGTNYTLRISAPGRATFADAAVSYSEDGSATVEGVAITFASTEDPTLCTVYTYTQRSETVSQFTADLVGEPQFSGDTVLDARPISFTVSSATLQRADLVRGQKYKVRSDKYSYAKTITVPNASSASLGDL